MLAIGIDLHERAVSLALCEKKRGSHGAAHADIERKGDHHGAGLPGSQRCGIGGAVVHDEDVSVRAMLANLRDDVGDRPLLIPGRDRHEHALASHKGSR